MIYHTDIVTSHETSSSCFDCHDGAVYEVCAMCIVIDSAGYINH